MNMPIIKLPQAQRDLQQLARYLGEQSPTTGFRFYDPAEKAFQSLARMPEMGSLWGSANPQFVDMRVWPIRRFENFLIFYRPLNQGIEVIRVLHASRDIESIFEP
jgi:toxin ParE1/3/4